eukprot:1399712-Alexandrium_andersonii.AAC.1
MQGDYACDLPPLPLSGIEGAPRRDAPDVFTDGSVDNPTRPELARAGLEVWVSSAVGGVASPPLHE